jgi:hypothetical protein
MRVRRFPDFTETRAARMERPGRVFLELDADQAPRAVSALREGWMCAARADERVLREAAELVTPQRLLAVASGQCALLQVDLWLDPFSRLVVGLPVPGRYRFALWRLHRRVQRVLVAAGVSAELLNWSVSGAWVLTGAGKTLRYLMRAVAAGELAWLLPELVGARSAAALLAEWIGLLLVAAAGGTAAAVWLWARVTGRSTGVVVRWPNGTHSGMSFRQRQAALGAARR